MKNVLFGFFSWLIPFVLSIPFFNQNGQLLVEHDLFKSVMIVTGSISGCYLMFRYFKLVDGDFIMNGIVVGISWLAINIIFDTIILIPMMKVSFFSYLMSIGLGYLVIPVISTAMGFLLDRKLKA